MYAVQRLQLFLVYELIARSNEHGIRRKLHGICVSNSVMFCMYLERLGCVLGGVSS